MFSSGSSKSLQRDRGEKHTSFLLVIIFFTSLTRVGESYDPTGPWIRHWGLVEESNHNSVTDPGFPAGLDASHCTGVRSFEFFRFKTVS